MKPISILLVRCSILVMVGISFGCANALTIGSSPKTTPDAGTVLPSNAPSPIVGDGSLANPGFELGTSGWLALPGDALGSISSQSRSGTGSIKLIDGSRSVSQRVTGLKPATTYEFSAYLKTAGKLGVQDYGGAVLESATTTSASFSRVVLSFTIGAQSTSALLYIKGTGSSIAIADDVTCTAIVVIPKPSEVLELDSWKLTLPVDLDADTKADEIKQPDLVGYEISPWFRTVTDGNGAAVAFRAAAGGVKTSSNTKFARSELREMDPPPNNTVGGAAWRIGDGKTHTMSIRQAITALTVKRPHVAAGQIHDANNDAFMLKCEGANPGGTSNTGKLVAYLDNAKVSFAIDSNYVLGTVFTMTIIISPEGAVTILYNTQSTVVTDWTNGFVNLKADGNPSLDGMYFKAGCYIQSNVVDYGELPDDFAEVKVYGLSISHS